MKALYIVGLVIVVALFCLVASLIMACLGIDAASESMKNEEKKK